MRTKTPKHTQGPWIVEAYYNDSLDFTLESRSLGIRSTLPTNDVDFKRFLTGTLWDNGNGIEESEANLSLIAAAPELLDALKRILASEEAHETIHAPDGDDVARMMEYAACHEAAVAAINKAEGL